MKKTFTSILLAAVLLAACNSHHPDQQASDTAAVDTVKTDSGTTIIKTKEGKVLQTYPTATGPSGTGTATATSSPQGGQNANAPASDAKAYPYYIRGTLIHGEGGNITLDRLDGIGEIKPLYVETVNSEGKFAFDGTCSYPQLMQLRLPAGNLHFIVRPKDTIDFTMTLETPGEYDVKGSIESLRLKHMYDILNKANDEKDGVEQRLQNAKSNLTLYSHLVDLRVQEYNDIDKVKHAQLRKFIHDNDTSFVCLLAAMYLDPQEDIELIKKLDKEFVLKYPSSPFYQALHEKVAIYGPTSLGMVAPEIISQTPDGKTVKLTSLFGKYVLVDFWASWCQPCRAEAPNIRKAWDKYKGKGLEILSYSLDNDKSAWTKAIKEDKMDWINVSDLLGFKSAGAATYIVTEIPSNFLLDKEGHIVAKNLTGAALQKKLAQLIH